MLNVNPANAIATIDKAKTDRRSIALTVNGSESLNLLQAQRLQKFGQLRAVFIDTSAQDSNGNGLSLQTDLGQTIKAAPGTQGYYPVFCPFVTAINSSCNEACNVQLYDFDVAPNVWSLTAAKAPASQIVGNVETDVVGPMTGAGVYYFSQLFSNHTLFLGAYVTFQKAVFTGLQLDLYPPNGSPVMTMFREAKASAYNDYIPMVPVSPLDMPLNGDIQPHVNLTLGPVTAGQVFVTGVFGDYI